MSHFQIQLISLFNLISRSLTSSIYISLLSYLCCSNRVCLSLYFIVKNINDLYKDKEFF
jgi:hypothetical protein